jgi:hypothetical protein
VRTVSTGGGQEILYVWGCLHPQRFRQWSITASAEAPRLHLRPTDPGQNFSAFPGSRW